MEQKFPLFLLRRQAIGLEYFPILLINVPPGGVIPHFILTHPRFMQGFFKLLLDSPKICLNFPKIRQTNSQWR